MENQLFRQKSLDHISSPEELHDYMRVTNPRLWAVLIAIVLLLGGFLVYAATTRMESTETVTFRVSEGYIYHGSIPENRMDVIKVGMPVRIAGETGTIDNFDTSIQYRLNITFDGEAPEKGRSYMITLGEEWSGPQVEAYENRDFSKDEDEAQAEGENGKIPHVITSYDDYGFTVSSYVDPQVLKKLDGTYSRVRVWKYDYLENDDLSLTEGRLATVDGYEPITTVYAAVSLDNPEAVIPNGNYEGEIVTESTTPISFLWN